MITRSDPIFCFDLFLAFLAERIVYCLLTRLRLICVIHLYQYHQKAVEYFF